VIYSKKFNSHDYKTKGGKKTEGWVITRGKGLANGLKLFQSVFFDIFFCVVIFLFIGRLEVEKKKKARAECNVGEGGKRAESFVLGGGVEVGSSFVDLGEHDRRALGREGGKKGISFRGGLWRGELTSASGDTILSAEEWTRKLGGGVSLIMNEGGLEELFS